MKRFIYLLIILFCVNSYSAEFINKGETFTADSIYVIVGEYEYIRIDSLLNYYEKVDEENKLYKLRAELSDSIEQELQLQVFNLNSQTYLFEQKLKLSLEKDFLREEQVRIKDRINQDLEKDIDKYRSKKGISNNFLWFGSGTIIGALTIYLSSVILSNISN